MKHRDIQLKEVVGTSIVYETQGHIYNSPIVAVSKWPQDVGWKIILSIERHYI